MNYTIDPTEPIADEIKRIAYEEIDAAIAELEQADEKPNAAIHEARKSFKKIRGTLRLVRDEIGKKVYTRENICFRDAGRQLSDARDSFVQIETLRDVRNHFADQLVADAFACVEKQLVERHAATLASTVEKGHAIETVLESVRAARARVADWPIEQEGFDPLYEGLQRVYKRGRRRYVKAYRHPTIAQLHEWRKRVKYLRYHVDMLERAWPNVLDELEDSLHDLTDYLGDDHDLAVLRHTVMAQPDLCDDDATVQALLGLIDHRRRALQAAAWPLGARIYVEKPKAFTRRMAIYWAAAETAHSGKSAHPCG